MICPKCGMLLPDDSGFCQYCGSSITVTADQLHPTTEAVLAEHSPISASQHFGILGAFSNTVAKDNGEKSNVVKRERAIETSWIIALCSLAIVLLFLLGANIIQFIAAKRTEAQLTELLNSIDSLNSVISEKDKEISAKAKEITEKDSVVSTLNDLIDTLETDAENYRTVVAAVKSSDFGYAASNFYTSEDIIVVDMNEKNRKFTLTAHWSNGGNVSVDYDSFFPAAFVDFDQDSWSTSTKMTVQPNYSGVTVVSFSNDVNSQIFNVIIIVE